ncbi:MAG: CoA transferase [Gammaproteobacteria bacterium]|nr:CoA transferase [Gammaproteobacteria bacterium]
MARLSTIFASTINQAHCPSMQANRLLEDVRVIDLSQYIPGPFATRQLADLGAEVIKIEPPGGDPMQFFMHTGANEISPIYRHLNRGKRICRLNLKNDPDRQALRELIADADILLESFRPGVLERLGFDRDTLDQINPKLIHCALSGYGQAGPYAQRAGHDINYCALSSQSIVSGTLEQPVIGYPPIADHAAAMQASIAMLAALHARDSSPGGTYLDISIAESILSWQYLPMLANADERAASILNGGAACYNLYQCADGLFISLGAIETAFWKNFCDAIQKTEWISRQFEVMPQQDLIAEVAEIISQHSQSHWRELLDNVDCCFEILFTVDSLARHAQFESRQAITDNGPAFPAWINQQPVNISVDFEEIKSSDQLRWTSIRC